MRALTTALTAARRSDLAQAWAQIVVAIEARDARVGRQVENVSLHQAADVDFGKHYAAALEHDLEGATVADLARLNHLEDDPVRTVFTRLQSRSIP